MWQMADWRSRSHSYCWIDFKKFLRKKNCSNKGFLHLMGLVHYWWESSQFTSGPMFLTSPQPLRLSEECGHLERAPCKAWCSVTSNGASWRPSGYTQLENARLTGGDYISLLAQECLGISQEELESVALERVMWNTLLSMLPPWSKSEQAKVSGWIEEVALKLTSFLRLMTVISRFYGALVCCSHLCKTSVLLIVLTVTIVATKDD